MIKYFMPVWAVFGILAGFNLPGIASAAQHQAKFASIDYDVVYVRCPRGKEPVSRNGTEDLLNWNGVNDLWLSATNNVYHQPGCDLVLHDSSMLPGDRAAEKVLVDCDEDDTSNPVCSVADPNVSFDGRYVVYTKFTDTRTFLSSFDSKGVTPVAFQAFMRLDPNGAIGGNRFASWLYGDLKPYANPALVFIYDLQMGIETQVSPDSKMFAGRAHPGKGSEWTSNIPVMDTGPFFMPDGRIGFTSNRQEGFGMFQLFAMDRDGRNMEVLSHRAMKNQLHPATLMDGRIVYTNFDRMLQRTSNNNFSLFEINPDGSAPFIFAGKNDATFWSYHYFTQLSDGDIVVTLYYTHQQIGLGALERFPVDPPGPDFVHRTNQGNTVGDVLTSLPDTWRSGTSLVPFARPKQFRLTPRAGSGDTQMPPYDPSEYFVHPVGGRTVTMNGRFSHPAAAPDNDLLATYSIGGSSTIDSSVFRDTTLEAVMKVIGKDAGIWLLPLEPNSSRQIGHIADDGEVVVDFPEYHEIMARAVVSYQDIYGIARPDPNNTRPPTSNDGTKDQRLPAGAPYGLTGAASMYDRETLSLNGTPWNMKDGGGAMSGRTYMNLAVSGAELAIFDNDEIFGIRVLIPVPQISEDLEPYIRAEKWAGYQRHHLRILGEYPVRKPDGNGVEPVDEQGNPDTSFIVRVPADTPFLMQTIDKRGMALDIETASRSVARGEQQFCAGCHVHTREGMDPFTSRAKTNVSEFGDFTGISAPLFEGEDANGYPTVASARETYAGEAGVMARRSFAVDWDNNIAAIVQNRCASCHAEGQPAQQLTGLRLDGNKRAYELLTKNKYTREDGTAISFRSKPGDGLTDIDEAGTDRITLRYQCCTPSRWISVNSARSSMLVWALYGERLDGRDPITGLPPAGSGVVVDERGKEYPEIWPKVSEHLAYVSDMPVAEKRLIARWLDIGAPKVNVHNDMMRPVMTLTPVGGSSVNSILVGLWDDSPLDFTRFSVTANGVDITPEVTGSPDTITVFLPTTVTEGNADSIEITLEIWDKPDRSWSRTRPGETAANRTRRTVTGRALLRMIGSSVTNRAPTFASATITTYEDIQSAGVFALVTDPDVGDAHIVSIVSLPSNGSAEVIGNKLVYTPSAGFVGDDSFQFSASDLGGLSVTGTANVTVLAGPPPGNSAPTAASASITTNEGTQSAGVSAQVTDSDDGDNHVISIFSSPSNGNAQVIGNQLVYTPNGGFSGSDSFQFRATDSGGLSVIGTASVTVLASADSTDSGSGGGSGGGGFGMLSLLVLLLLKCGSAFVHYPHPVLTGTERKV
ncbi:MAG: Ig-like domain-containing protein [Gammaproteobacteria bacterium]|nr:Ig-like domain-containing protein [Gammaproteobacteria bacterium]